MNKRSPALVAAMRIARLLVCRSQSHRPLDSAIEDVQANMRWLDQEYRLICKARSHNWQAAANQVVQKLNDALMAVQRTVVEAIQRVPDTSSAPASPKLGDILPELHQLQEEFDDVGFENGTVSAVTDPIELEGVYLGAFRIELHVSRLGQHADSSAFDIVAIEPHPPESNGDVTHPHVQDKGLCAGDATVPISQALSQGRICDAFLAIKSVLATYNPHSPYVALENWTGTSCDDCGCTTSETHYCDHCQKDYCDDCYSCCDVCHDGCCGGCMETDEKSEVRCCPHCRKRCSECNRIVDSDSFVEESGLCPECHEQHTKEHQEQENAHEDEHEDSPDVSGDPGQPALVAAAAATVAVAVQADPTEACPDLCPAGVAEAQVLPARPRRRSRRVRRQQ